MQTLYVKSLARGQSQTPAFPFGLTPVSEFENTEVAPYMLQSLKQNVDLSYRAHAGLVRRLGNHLYPKGTTLIADDRGTIVYSNKGNMETCKHIVYGGGRILYYDNTKDQYYQYPNWEPSNPPNFMYPVMMMLI